MKKAKFGARITRWKVDKKWNFTSHDEVIYFRGDPALENTIVVDALAKAAAGRKWKQTERSGWDLSETWMEPPHCW